MEVAFRKDPVIHTAYQFWENRMGYTCPRMAQIPFLCISVADTNDSDDIISSIPSCWAHLRFLRIIVRCFALDYS
jgi:hypothetical protein